VPSPLEEGAGREPPGSEKIADPVVEEAYVEDVGYRFSRLQDSLKAVGKK
jgi:hypothetical protein